MAEIFTTVVDCIFKNKPKLKPTLTYDQLTEEDKEVNFFMINRKFAYKYIDQAEYFNKKGIDKASAIDLWNLFFKKVKGTPPWYWGSSTAKKEKEKTSKKFTKADVELLMQHCNLSEDEFKFLETNYKSDLDKELKKLKKFEI